MWGGGKQQHNGRKDWIRRENNGNIDLKPTRTMETIYLEDAQFEIS
jgi:hypothetical protein